MTGVEVTEKKNGNDRCINSRQLKLFFFELPLSASFRILEYGFQLPTSLSLMPCLDRDMDVDGD